MGGIITLTTDFGLKDPYQGAMKGAILSINPSVKIVDITHLVTPGNILEGALILFDAYRFYPEGTIHVGVVDPGVGGVRRPVLIETGRYCFVGPDNGLFSLIAGSERVLRVVHLTEKRYFLKDVSPTFHGRDIFGPVAAHLSAGLDAGLFGTGIKGKVSGAITLPAVKKRGGAVTGTVIYIDSFGNLVTNISREDLIRFGRGSEIESVINGHSIKGLKKTFGLAKKGTPLALIGSSNRLEIAVNCGHAAELLKAKAGDSVTVRAIKAQSDRVIG